MRLQVRQETSAVHQALDMAWLAADGFASRRSYLAFLRAAKQAHLRFGLPAAIQRADGSEALEHRRITALGQDLGDPGTPWEARGTMDRSFSWGVGYALNGSALGAATILKHGRLGPDWPRQYLEMGRDYARTGGVRRFFAQLDIERLDQDGVVAGALAVFEVFRSQSTGSEPEQHTDSSKEFA